MSTTPNKCNCERAANGGAQCMVHNPPFPICHTSPKQEKKQVEDCGCVNFAGNGLIRKYCAKHLAEHTTKPIEGEELGMFKKPIEDWKKSVEWEREYDKQFGSLTLGVLSGDKNSPVFINNELEVPRLKSFIKNLLLSEREKAFNEGKREGMEEEAINCYDHVLAERSRIIGILEKGKHPEDKEYGWCKICLGREKCLWNISRDSLTNQIQS